MNQGKDKGEEGKHGECSVVTAQCNERERKGKYECTTGEKVQHIIAKREH
jgi:hypothetical protein